MLLHLLAHTIKKTAASATGSRLKAVVCEKCQTQYWYLLSRLGTGQTSSFLFVGNGAFLRAQKAAERDVAKRLDREVELVPCPRCHWVNQKLVSLAGRRKYRGAVVLAIVLLALGGIAYPLVANVAEGNSRTRSNEPTILAGKVSAGFVVAAVAVLLIRSLLRRRMNPNRHFPQPPTIPPGTPSAMVPANDSGTPSHLALVNVHYDCGIDENRWAILRSGQFVFPNVCCLCMNETTSVYSARLRMNEQRELPVPFCKQCKRTFRPIWWFAALLIVVGSAALGGAAAIAIPGIDETGRWIVAAIVMFFGSIIGLYTIPNRVCRPYRFSTIDQDRGVIRFAFKNEEFTRLLNDQARESEALLASRTVP